MQVEVSTHIFFKMNNIYVYAEHNYAAVGAFIGVCLIKERVDDSRLTTLLKAYRYYKDLVKAGKLIYVDYMAAIEDINVEGVDSLFSKALNGLLLGLNTYETTGIRNKHCPYSTDYRLKIETTIDCPGLRLTQYIVRSRRIGWIKKVAYNLYPHYDWRNNYGLDTYYHAKQVLLYGGDMSIHTEDFLLNLAKYWLQGLREYDLDIVTGYDYSNPKPIWWHRLFGDLEFTHCLTTEEKTELNHLIGTTPLNPIQEMINSDIARYLKELRLDAHL